MSLTEDLLGALLRQGGYVVNMVEAYFDESGTHADSAFLCVAGYIFQKEACSRFSEEWSHMLAEYRLPYFRMSQCAPDPGNGPFAALTKPQRIAISTRAIGLIKQYSTLGYAVSIDMQHAYLLPSLGGISLTPYTFACWQGLMAVRNWAEQSAYQGKIAYFFESGHKSQGEANQLMSNLFKIPEFRSDYRYTSHTFGDKREFHALQAADVLAWQWFTHRRRIEAGHKRYREDLNSLVEKATWVTHYGKKEILELRSKLELDRAPGKIVGLVQSS